MEAKSQSYWWWFDSHNSPSCSPWLNSTLADLNEKTKTMLKIIEEDADSFAQRAEMYYKKRPELISMVEDFYRAHRSLAERYDQLRGDRPVRVRSPLRHSVSLLKDEYENVFDSVTSVKSFDSFTEVAYSSEDVYSEIDDPEHEVHGEQVEGEIEKPSAGWASFDEIMKLRDELDRLREENEIQKREIKLREQEKEDLVMQLSNVSEVRKLSEEIQAIKEEDTFILVEQSSEAVPIDDGEKLEYDIEILSIDEMDPMENKLEYDTETHSMDEMDPMQDKHREEEEIKVTNQLEIKNRIEVLNLMDEIDSLKLQNMIQNELFKLKAEEKSEVTKELDEAKYELQETQRENKYLKDVLALREEHVKRELEEKLEVPRQLEETKYKLVKLIEDIQFEELRQFEETKYELVKLREEAQTKNRCLDIALDQLKLEEEVKTGLTKHLKKANGEIMKVREQMQREDKYLENVLAQLKQEVEAKIEVIRQLKQAKGEIEKLSEQMQRESMNQFIKDKQKHQATQLLKDSLVRKDEEKREVIRQLSLAMEIVREENQLLKKLIVKDASNKQGPVEFQFFKGFQFSKLFNLSSRHQASDAAP